MPYCSKCQTYFQPSPDEEKLIVAGQVDGSLCSKCYAGEYAEREEKSPAVRYVGQLRGDGSVLNRAEWYDATGKLVSFVARPRRVKNPHLPTLRKPSATHPVLHTQMMGGQDCDALLTTEIPVRLHNNLASFRKRRTSLWIRKIPSFSDPLTGTGSIEIPAENVDEEGIVQEGKRVTVPLRDGGRVELHYF